MPGLSQLKQFNKDILSLGDEVSLRAQRGEKPVIVSIPKSIKDENDSEDFIMGMPEIEAIVQDNSADDDLSDLAEIAGLTKPAENKKEESAAPSFQAPDLSSLLAPMPSADDGGMGMPDLSDFMEPEEEEVVEEAEPEPPSIADMSLEDLLGGAGFDGSSVETVQQEEDTVSADEEEFYTGGFGDENYIPQKREPPKTSKMPQKDSFSAVDIDDLDNEPAELGAALSLEELGLGGLDNTDNTIPGDALDIESFDEPEELGDLGEVEDLDAGTDNAVDLSMPEDLGADTTEIPTETEAATDMPADTGTADFDFGDLSMPDDLGEIAIESPADDISLPADDLAMTDDLGEIPIESPADDISLPAEDTGSDLGGMDFGDIGDLGLPEDTTADPLADLGDMGEATDIGDMPSLDETPAETESPELTEGFGSDFTATDGLDDLGDLSMPDDLGADTTDTPAETSDADVMDFGDLSMPDDLGADTTETTTEDTASDLGGMDFGDIGDLGLPEDTTADPLADLGDMGEATDIGDMPSLDETPAETESPELTEGFGSDFTATDGIDDLGDISMPDDLGADTTDTPAETSDADVMDFGDIGDLGLPEDSGADPLADLGDMGEATDDISLPADDLSMPDDIGTSTDDISLSADDLSMPDDFGTPDGLFNSGDIDGETPDISEEVPDFGADDFEMADSASPGQDEEVSLEIFDTSEMDGIEFNIPDTDSQIGDSGFELGEEGDFGIEGQDFEIPGFSDVETAKEERSPSILSFGKKQGSENEDLPPNTLSDAQYKQFLKNLGEYPLNVRLAFEDLIVKNEFTDEAEFEIIEKILNKSSARSVASMLEKMLDISIPVPRDYEHRTAEEYEAYKKSLQYQLKNKIIPGVFAAMICLVVGFGLFQFGKNCIYIPAKANKLYKQGYALLEADEYPQSEIKFTEATGYRLNKNWFFKYARGYRTHKQYSRAEWMYQNILRNFKHNKEAGLEYARMELEDLANYQKAEEICRREILDFHINDSDGILLLGDIFLEWGTEKDPEMLEKAREQYATLIQLYKPNLLYQSRMMRYFIRTDNLRNVLQLKELFIPKEKNLSADDWTELAGYLMDKLYGPIAPSDEYLRTEIEDVRLMLMRAVKLDPKNPIATYNLSRYFIETNETNAAKESLTVTIDNFKNSTRLHKRDIYKYIDSYRLLGEQYAAAEEYMRAQEHYTDGISLYTAERDASGFAGTKQIGVLFADQANIDYFVSGDFENALNNYKESVKLQNDTPSIRYRIGYINYKQKNYTEALGSFMKAGDGNIKETNLMLAMANTLSLRGDNYAAQGYYEALINDLDRQIEDKGIVLAQAGQEDRDILQTYIYAANNYGVTLYRLASRTGNSSLNAEAIVQLSQSIRAWDALNRNPDTLIRLGGSNLAEENIRYITHPIPAFEPAIYIDIPRILLNTERF